MLSDFLYLKICVEYLQAVEAERVTFQADFLASMRFFGFGIT